MLAGDAQALAREILEHLAGPARLHRRLGENFAFLAREQQAQLLAPGQDLGPGTVEDIGPLLKRARRPAGECGARRRDRLLGLSTVGLGVLADHVAEIGGVEVLCLLARIDPFAGDEVLVDGHCDPSWWARSASQSTSTPRPGASGSLARAPSNVMPP